MVKYIDKNDPLEYYECDFGNDGVYATDLQISLSREVGEFIDIYCVAKNERPLAALDFSTYGKNKVKKSNSFNKLLINRIIQYCNYKKVKALHNKKRGGKYLKTVFFKQKNYKNALTLMYIFWSPEYPHLILDTIQEIAKIEGIQLTKNEYVQYLNIISTILVGLLLGYKQKNILFFIETKLNFKEYKLNKKNIFKKLKLFIDNLDISLEELNKYGKFVLLDPIPTI